MVEGAVSLGFSHLESTGWGRDYHSQPESRKERVTQPATRETQMKTTMSDHTAHLLEQLIFKRRQPLTILPSLPLPPLVILREACESLSVF